MKFTEFLAVFLIFYISLGFKYVMSIHIHFGKFNMDNALTTINKVSLANCMEECSKRPDCKSINYVRHSLFCVLYGISYGTTDLGTKSKLVYVNIRSDTMTPVYQADSCTGLSCVPGTVCETNQCQIKECINETVLEGGTIFGNLNKIGNKRLLQCDSNFDLSGPGEAVCQADGTWSPFGTCDESCGKPIYPPDLDIDSGRLFLEVGGEINTTDVQFIRDQTKFGTNSEIKFTCPTATVLVSVDTMCINGSWTPLGSCIPLSPVETSCRSNGQCQSVFQSECRNKTCKCKAPKSYSYAGNECIDSCTTVDNTFQRERDMQLTFKDDLLLNSVTLEQCFDICVNVTAFVCLSFEFRHSDGQCVVSRDNAFSGSLVESVGTTFFQRDCKT